MKQVLLGGSQGNPVNNNYNPIIGLPASTQWGTSSLNGRINIVPINGTLSNFRVKVTTAPGDAKTVTFTVFKNLTATSLSVSITGAGTTYGEDTSNTVSISAGDYINIKCTTTNTPTLSASKWSFLFDSDDDNKSFLSACRVGLINTTGVEYNMLEGGETWIDTTEPTRHILCSAFGTLSNLYVILSEAPSAGNSHTFTIYKNGSSTSLSVTISGATATSGSDNSNSFSLVPGDTLSIEHTVSGGIAVYAGWGVGFFPTTNGEFLLPGSDGDLVSNLNTEYNPLVGGDGTWLTTQSTVDNIIDSVTISDLYVEISGTPGAGNSYDFTLMQNLTQTSLTCNISGTQLLGSNTSNSFTTIVGDVVALQSIPTSSPTQRLIRWGCKGVYYTAPTPSGAIKRGYMRMGKYW